MGQGGRMFPLGLCLLCFSFPFLAFVDGQTNAPSQPDPVTESGDTTSRPQVVYTPDKYQIRSFSRFLYYSQNCQHVPIENFTLETSHCTEYYTPKYKLCWPRTPSGQTAYVSCPNYTYHDEEGQPSVVYVPLSEAQSEWKCSSQGRWLTSPNFSQCAERFKVKRQELYEELHKKDNLDQLPQYEMVFYTYAVGLCVSILSILVALFIFCKFRRLRCLRNYIHTQLLTAILLSDALLLILYFANLEQAPTFCKVLQVLYRYFATCWFSWMFVEGFYIFINIICAFTKPIKFTYFLIFGWGVPLVIIAIWVSVTLTNPSLNAHWCWLPQRVKGEMPPTEYIIQIPSGLLLVANFGFMVAILYVLVKKLLASSQAKQHNLYRKAVKATLVLTPLLGLTYLLLIFSPENEDPSATPSIVFLCFHAAVISTEGFWVSLAYCFLNGEVQGTIAKWFRKWKERRSMSFRSSSDSTSRRRSHAHGFRRYLRRLDSHSRGELTESEFINSRRSSRRTGSGGDADGSANGYDNHGNGHGLGHANSRGNGHANGHHGNGSCNGKMSEGRLSCQPLMEEEP